MCESGPKLHENERIKGTFWDVINVFSKILTKLRSGFRIRLGLRLVSWEMFRSDLLTNFRVNLVIPFRYVLQKSFNRITKILKTVYFWKVSIVKHGVESKSNE